ncbi:hypothetical protein FQN53_000684 [Emmonsiellopsis sp. PD_33]|nr:hypothetical protein FQN53_000684 [Emmonsiellopsis sp. PD_33]
MFPGFVADRMLIARVLKFAASNIDTRGIFSNFCGIQARFTTTCHFSQKTLIFLRPAKTSTDPRPQHQFRRDFIVRKNVVGTWLGFLRHSFSVAIYILKIRGYAKKVIQTMENTQGKTGCTTTGQLFVHSMYWTLPNRQDEILHHLAWDPQDFNEFTGHLWGKVALPMLRHLCFTRWFLDTPVASLW